MYVHFIIIRGNTDHHFCAGERTSCGFLTFEFCVLTAHNYTFYSKRRESATPPAFPRGCQEDKDIIPRSTSAP